MGLLRRNLSRFVASACSRADSGVNYAAVSAADFITQFDALQDEGGNGGATMAALFVPGVNQTVVANGTSPSGYYCTVWDPIGRVGDGFVADPGVNSGNGAPCTAEGYILGPGLYIPAASALLVDLLAATSDTTTAGGVEIGWPNDLLKSRSNGFSIGMMGRIVNETTPWQWGEDGGTNTLQMRGSIIQDEESLRDPIAGHYPNSLSPAAGGSLPLTLERWYCKSNFTSYMAQGNFSRTRFGRDLFVLHRNGTVPQPNILATGRNFYLLKHNALDSNTVTGQYHSNETRSLWPLLGRPNQAQTAFLHNWLEAQFWCFTNLWKDSRRIGYWFENSFIEPFDGVSSIDSNGLSYRARIVRGADGASRIPNFTLLNFATSGGSIPVPQGPLYYLVEDGDYQRRSQAVGLIHERINNSTEAQNIALWQSWLSRFGSKARLAATDLLYNTAAQKTARAGEFATQVADASTYGVQLAQTVYTAPYSDELFDASEPLLWELASGAVHPYGPTRTVIEPTVRLALMAALGESTSAKTCYVLADTHYVDIDASAEETAQPTWTALDRDRNTLAKTLTFESADETIATVDPDTGEITGVDAGDCIIWAVSPDGARGLVIARITGTAPGGDTPVTPTFQLRFDDAANLKQVNDGTTAVTTTGNPIGYAADLSGSGNHATQPLNGGYRPTWNSAGHLATDGANQWLELPDACAPLGAFRIHAVAEFNPNGTVQSLFCRAYNGGVDPLWLGVTQFNTLKIGGVFGGVAKAVAHDISALTGKHWIKVVYDGATLELFVDGVSVGSVAASGALSYTSTDRTAIAGRRSTVNGYANIWQGKVYEVTLHEGTTTSGVIANEDSDVTTHWSL